MLGLALCVGASLLAACGDDPTTAAPPPSDATSSTTAAPPPSDATGSTATTDDPGPTQSTLPPRDWDNVQFDFGDVIGIEEISDAIVIDFDRHQLYGASGLESAPDFTEEPILYGNTGVESVNENTRVRTYTMHPDAEVLVLGNSDDVCNSQGSVDARWDRLSRDAFLSARPWEDFGQVSVTFDQDGLVERLRFANGC